MPDCDTCAFGKPGSGGAADEGDNSLTAQICAYGGLPFFCHHGKDGTESDWQNDPLGPLRLLPSNRKVCSGWQAQVATLKRHGYFDNPGYNRIRRFAARQTMAWFKRFSIPEMGGAKKKTAWKKVKFGLKFLMTRDIGKLEIPS